MQLVVPISAGGVILVPAESRGLRRNRIECASQLASMIVFYFELAITYAFLNENELRGV
jgi:hypothetical protein